MAKKKTRDWSDAIAKRDREGRCRTCKTIVGIETAHVMGRANDLRVGVKHYVHPDAIIPLCRKCHALYDGHQLDVLHTLTLDEQLLAVEDAGSVETMRRRTAPLAYDRQTA